MEAIVLCGGLGTRLRAVYPNTPKALASVGHRYFLDILLTWLHHQGVRRCVLAAGHLSDQLQKYVQEHPPKGLDIIFSVEEVPLGTGGALALAAEKTQSENILALNGDSLCPLNLADFHRFHLTTPSTPTIAATRVSNAASFGVLETNKANQILGFHTQAAKDPRPGLVNSGLYWLPQTLLKALPTNKSLSLENEIFPRWAKEKQGLKAFVHDTPFQDIGTPERLAQAEHFLQGQR